MLFYRLLQQSVATTPATYANIRDNEHQAPPALLATETVELKGYPVQKYRSINYTLQDW